MIAVPPNTKIWIALGRTDMRRGFNGLSLMVQEQMRMDPWSGHGFVFRGRRGDYIKILWADGHGLCLFSKRLEEGLFAWPSLKDGTAPMTSAQLAMLLDGLEWRTVRDARRGRRAG
jgi:transposase